MTKISVPLTSEEEAALVARAKAQGISVDISCGRRFYKSFLARRNANPNSRLR
jgi:hypothetical protein